MPAYIIERQKAEEEAQREYDAYIKVSAWSLVD